jgi:hypothetical protein
MQYAIASVDEYVSVCCVCGCALKTEEIAARMVGDFQDFEVKGPPQYAAIVFCSDCKTKVEQYANDTVLKAWIRMQQLDRL